MLEEPLPYSELVKAVAVPVPSDGAVTLGIVDSVEFRFGNGGGTEGLAKLVTVPLLDVVGKVRLEVPPVAVTGNVVPPGI